MPTKLPANDERTKVVQLRFTSKEAKWLEKQAKNRSLTGFLTEKLLELIPAAHRRKA